MNPPLLTVPQRAMLKKAAITSAAALAALYVAEKRAKAAWNREQEEKEGSSKEQPPSSIVLKQMTGSLVNLKVTRVIKYICTMILDLLNPERMKANKKDYVKRLLAIVWPSFELSRPFDLSTPGKREILSIGAATLVRTWLLNRSAKLQKKLTGAAYRRDSDAFKACLGAGALITVVGSACSSAYNYNKEMLCVVWRDKLTRTMHDAYFKHMAFYHITNLPAGKAILDPDERLSREIASASRRLVNLVTFLFDATPPMVWFTYQLYRHKGWKYALCPHIYLMLAYEVAQRIFPKNIGKLWKNVAGTQSNFNKAASRLQTHSEAVAALGGSQVEQGILSGLHGKTVDATRELHMTQSKFNLTFKLAYTHACKAWMTTAVMLPTLLSPGTADSISPARLAQDMADTAVTLDMMITCGVANGQMLTLHATAEHMIGVCKRICVLLDTLDAIGAQQSKVKSTTFIEGENIAFNGVEVYTPSGNHLVHDLNFEVAKGEALLITGHNGAGKSSIFRCLGGLWAVPQGSITKPGASEAGLHSAIFYLPQKPYNVLGSLKEQITYPLPPAEANLGADELKKLLVKVELQHLLERGGGADEEVVNWEDRLSLGEQQRLAMARLFYHCPKIAILDECTSAVSSEMEELLYLECANMGIAYITICHRPALKAFHDTNLNLTGDGKGGWTHGPIPDGRGSLKHTRSRLNLLEDQQRQKVKAKASSTTGGGAHAGANKQQKKTLTMSLTRKMRLLGGILLPGNVGNLAVLVGAILVNTMVHESSTFLVGRMYRAMAERKTVEFILFSSVSAMQDLGSAWVEEAVTYFQNRLTTTWNEQLTSHAMSMFFKDNAFYNLKNLDRRITDCDRRLTEEISDLSTNLTSIWAQAVQPVVDIAWFSYRIKSLLGPKDITTLYSYFAACVLVSQMAMPNHEKLNTKEKQLESRFRFIHGRLRNHSESVAFFGGGEREHAIADKALTDVSAHASVVKSSNAWYKFLFHCVNKDPQAANQTQNYVSVPEVLTAYLQMQYGMQQGAADGATGAAGSLDIAHSTHYVQSSVKRTITAFSKVIDLNETISKIAGAGARVCDMFQVLEEVTGGAKGGTPGGSSTSNPPPLESRGTGTVNSNTGSDGGSNNNNNNKSGMGCISFKDVDIITPNGERLASDLNVDVQEGRSLMVTGPNAVGKTSFFRVLAGLWPTSGGAVDLKVPREEVFLVPQKVYSVMGSLADQVTYPKHVSAKERTADVEARLLATLNQVGIGYLVDREGGWDAKRKWEDTLSLGEQQRLGIARLFYHKPMFGVLDECSDAVSADVEEQLYTALHKEGVTCITISKRLALTDFHENELRLGSSASPTNWELQAIEH